MPPFAFDSDNDQGPAGPDDDLMLTSTSDETGDEIVVIGFRTDYSSGTGGGGDLRDPSDPDTSLDPNENVTTQNCGNTNDIEGTTAPDGATYYSPEGVDADYLSGALNHIAGIYGNNPFNKTAVSNEIIAMYTDPSHAYFVDFKDWGTENGPVGSRSGGTVTYYSDAAGSYVSGSAFEAFGNYFFGVLCTFGGLAPEEIYAAAAWYSESGPFWEGDDPQDVPHVENGIADAQGWLAMSSEQQATSPLFTIEETQCFSW